MDKKIVLLIILFLVGGRTFSQVHYSIEGSTDHEYEGRKVALVMLEEDNRQADSTNVVNGKFIFKGELLQPCWAAVCIDGVDGIFTVLENGNIRICTDGKEGWCEGTPINDVFQKSWRECQVLNRAARDDFKKLDSLSVETDRKKELYAITREKVIKQTKEFIKRTVYENLDNIIPAFWIRLFQEQITGDELNAMLAGASPVLKSNRFITKLLSVQEGSSFVDSKVELPDSTKVYLSDYIGNGHYVLVNIWASWCGACIAELPEIRNAGEKYASKNLKLLSISIDRDRKDWEKALKRLGLPWTQVLADYSFVNSYGINKIPVLMLISPDGVILKRNFGIEDLNRLFQN